MDIMHNTFALHSKILNKNNKRNSSCAALSSGDRKWPFYLVSLCSFHLHRETAAARADVLNRTLTTGSFAGRQVAALRSALYDGEPVFSPATSSNFTATGFGALEGGGGGYSVWKRVPMAVRPLRSGGCRDAWWLKSGAVPFGETLKFITTDCSQNAAAFNS